MYSKCSHARLCVSYIRRTNSDEEQERKREEEKISLREKSVWRKISAPLFLSPGCFGKKNNTTTRFSENCTPVIYLEDGPSGIGSIRI